MKIYFSFTHDGEFFETQKHNAVISVNTAAKNWRAKLFIACRQAGYGFAAEYVSSYICNFHLTK